MVPISRQVREANTIPNDLKPGEPSLGEASPGFSSARVSPDQLCRLEGGAELLVDARRRTPFHVTLRFGALRLRVQCDDGDVLAAFARRYAWHAGEGSPDVTFYAMRTEAGYVFLGENTAAWEWRRGPLSTEAYAFLLDACALTAFVCARHLLSFHAAVVEREGGVTMIAAPSGRGKTTTLVACGLRGMRVYSDERCVIDGAHVVPFVRTLNIRAGGALLLRAAGWQTTIPAEGGQAEIGALLGAAAIAPAKRLSAILFLDRYASAPALEPVSLLQLAPSLLQWMQSREHRPLERLRRLLNALAGVQCFRMALGTPGDTARCIDDLTAARGAARAS